MVDRTYDVAVIGGGIIGISTAMRVAEKYPRLKVGVIEKEKTIAQHQSGHNSGVIHSGIYYAPGSLKAQNCVTGAAALKRFCDEEGIKYDLCGKVIVATTDAELPRLEELWRRGTANGVPGLARIDREQLRELEPHSAGISGLHSPATGIIDFAEVTRAYARRFEKAGGEIVLQARVKDVVMRADGTTLQTSKGDVSAKHVVNCGGLYADVIAKKMGAQTGIRIIPFRGEYYFLRDDARYLVKGLIYPVPDPEFPFLGVHFTRRIKGEVDAGPNAVLALAREGYSWTRVSPAESIGTLTYGGFWSMARKYWRTGFHEVYRSVSKAAFTKALQKLVPEIRSEHLVGGGSGVRAQCVDDSGKLIDDFRIVETKDAVHVLNAPSPGATASLSISAGILEMAERSFGLA